MKIATTKGNKELKSSAPERPEVDKAADSLIETIKQYRKRIDGITADTKQLLAEATDAIKRRLG